MLWCVLTVIFASADAGPLTLSPQGALAVEVAQAIGATVKNLEVSADADVSVQQRQAVEDALANTGLFVLGAAAHAPRLHLKRIEAGLLLVTITRADGERLWVGKVAWPEAGKLEPEARSDSSIYAHVLSYRRQRLSLQPVLRNFWYSPVVFGFGHYGAPFGGGRVGVGIEPMVAAQPNPTSWAIVRGKGEALDEVDFAQLIADASLEQRVHDARFHTRLWWGAGFGAGAALGLSTGAWLYWGASERQLDRRTGGLSLLTLGAVSGILALMFPAVGNDYHQTIPEAQGRIDAYNTTLREELGVLPSDLSKFPDEE